MPDIIQEAKKLLEGAKPAPWKVYAWERHPDSDVYVAGHDLAPVTGDGWIEPADGDLIAAAPELAQTLAEETWEYSAQAKRGEEWETCTNSETHLEEWWEDKGGAEWAAGQLQQQGHKTRIVRRRVSPPEVINE